MIRFRPVLTMIAASFLLVLLGYFGLWYYEASRVHAGITRFIDARAARGMMIRSETLQIRGFPFQLEADFGKLVIDGMPYDPPAHIEAPKLVAHARPWSPGVWRFEAPEGFRLSLSPQDGFTSTVGAARGRAEAELGYQGDLLIEIDGHDLSLGLGGSPWTADHGSLQLTVPDKPPEDHTSPSLSFAAVLDHAIMPSDIKPRTGMLNQLAIKGVIEGTISEEPLVTALSAWREAGGKVELRQLAVHWGDVDLAGEGTLTLDANLQPQAAFSGRIRGWGALLDDFVQAGSITPEQANYYRLGLGLLTRTADDGKSELKAPITLQNEQISLGPARIAKIPVITWN
jgi:hypothetical protein